MLAFLAEGSGNFSCTVGHVCFEHVACTFPALYFTTALCSELWVPSALPALGVHSRSVHRRLGLGCQTALVTQKSSL